MTDQKAGKHLINQIIAGGYRDMLYDIGMTDRLIRTIRDKGQIPALWADDIRYICLLIGFGIPDGAFTYRRSDRLKLCDTFNRIRREQTRAD